MALHKRRSPAAEQAVRKLFALRSRWLEAVVFDSRLTDCQVRIGIGAMYRYLNRDPEHVRFGMLWMSVGRLADELAAGERTVTRAFREFRHFGYFELIKPGGGKRKTSVYRPILPETVPIGAADTLPQAASYSEYPAANGHRTLPRAAPNLERVDLVHIERADERVRAMTTDIRGFEPRDEDCDLARSRGYDAIWIADQVERFRDHCLAIGRSYADVDAAWRNWQRIAMDRDECPPDPAASMVASPSCDARTSLITDERWREILIQHRDSGGMSRDWPLDYGLPPQSNATRVPQHLRKEFGWI